MLNTYWNLWHDVANNPNSAAERIALREGASLLSEQFQSLDGDLKQMATDLTSAISPEVDKINQITKEIAQLIKESSRRVSEGAQLSETVGESLKAIVAAYASASISRNPVAKLSIFADEFSVGGLIPLILP